MSALTNAVLVLRLFSGEHVELSVSDVSRRLKMPKSSASRLLKSMLREGLLATARGAPRYRLGHLFFEIAQHYGRPSSLMDMVDDILGTICRETRHSGYISILDGADVLVLRNFIGSEPLRVVTPLGSRAPAFATANGRTLLARLSDKEVRALHRGRLVPPSPNSPRTIDQLLRTLDRVRRVGWNEALDEAITGVGSVSVSVGDPANDEVLAFCVSFPAHMVSELERRRLAAMLIDAARHVGLQFGDRFWSTLKRQRVAAA